MQVEFINRTHSSGSKQTKPNFAWFAQFVLQPTSLKKIFSSKSFNVKFSSRVSNAGWTKGQKEREMRHKVNHALAAFFDFLHYPVVHEKKANGNISGIDTRVFNDFLSESILMEFLDCRAIKILDNINIENLMIYGGDDNLAQYGFVTTSLSIIGLSATDIVALEPTLVHVVTGICFYKASFHIEARRSIDFSPDQSTFFKPVHEISINISSMKYASTRLAEKKLSRKFNHYYLSLTQKEFRLSLTKISAAQPLQPLQGLHSASASASSPLSSSSSPPALS
uniref:Uncharacterized protein n=1 Tax=Glossina palpalis gambiensis TaxID=67801 RepID=A0A1B0BSK1_9MUSC